MRAAGAPRGGARGVGSRTPQCVVPGDVRKKNFEILPAIFGAFWHRFGIIYIRENNFQFQFVNSTLFGQVG